MRIGITHRLAILVATGALTASLRRQSIVPTGDHWWTAGVPVLQEGAEAVHAPGHVSKISDRTERTVLVSGSTRKGTTETRDGGDPTRSGSAGSARSRRLRTSDCRAFRWRELRYTGSLVLVIIRDGSLTLNVRGSGRTSRRSWRPRGLATTERHNDQRVEVGSLL
jgi:hypothetical protein